MAKDMMKIPVFKQTIERCASALKQFNIDLVEIVTNGTEKSFENVINSFLSIAAVQVALVEVLFSIGIEPDGIVGHSVGELGIYTLSEIVIRLDSLTYVECFSIFLYFKL